MGKGSNNDAWARRAFWNVGINYDRTFGKHAVYGQLKYDYEYSDYTGVNTTVYRQNYSLFAHYGYDNRYMADLALVYSGSSRLAKGSKWALSPTFSASWNIHNESFMQDVKWVDFLKLRASIGMIQTDNLPGDNVWTYYDQFYVMDGVTYPFYSYGSGFGRTYIAQAATQSLGREKAIKYNVGFDATLFKGLNISFDYYFQNRKDIWVSTEGAYTGVFGLTTPYENQGKVHSYGFEFAADYSKQIGKVTFNIGGNINLNKNKIKEQAEEPKLYKNLVSTDCPTSSSSATKPSVSSRRATTSMVTASSRLTSLPLSTTPSKPSPPSVPAMSAMPTSMKMVSLTPTTARLSATALYAQSWSTTSTSVSSGKDWASMLSSRA